MHVSRHLILVAGLAFLPLGCSDPISEAEPAVTDLWEAESIPYEVLGEGKLVFERIMSEDSDEDNSGVYVIDIDERASYGIGGQVFDGPAVSPDGRRIAYSRTRPFRSSEPATYWDIHLSDIDGSDEVRLTDLSGNEVSPTWLPGNQEIVFYEREASGNVVFYRQAASDGAEREIIHTLPATACSWVEGPASISGGRLAFSGRFCGDLTSQGIYSVPMDGGEVSDIVTSPGVTANGAVRLYSPVWSPDGRHLAYVEVLEETEGTERTLLRTQIQRVDADGENTVTLVSLDGIGRGEWASSNTISLTWSPDGSKLAFNHREGYLTSHIYVVGSDGSALQQITSAPGASDISLSWSE